MSSEYKIEKVRFITAVVVIKSPRFALEILVYVALSLRFTLVKS